MLKPHQRSSDAPIVKKVYPRPYRRPVPAIETGRLDS
jgi:hypothetical protein